jgi:hypothetical protein
MTSLPQVIFPVVPIFILFWVEVKSTKPLPPSKYDPK